MPGGQGRHSLGPERHLPLSRNFIQPGLLRHDDRRRRLVGANSSNTPNTTLSFLSPIPEKHEVGKAGQIFLMIGPFFPPPLLRLLSSIEIRTMIYSSRDDLTGDNSHQSGDEVLAELRTMLPLTANKRFPINYFRRLDAIGFTEVGGTSVGSIHSQPVQFVFFFSCVSGHAVWVPGFQRSRQRHRKGQRVYLHDLPGHAGQQRDNWTNHIFKFYQWSETPPHFPFPFGISLSSCAANIGVNVGFVSAGACNSVTHPSIRASSM